jgi:glycosyltransferase involved in cell wall biosynthesis
VKKVLFMLTSMNIGGVEKSLLSLLSTMPKEKYDVTVLLLEKKGCFLSELPSWVKIEEANWFKEIKPIIMQPPQQTLRCFYKDKQYIKFISFINTYLVSKQFDNRFFYYKQVLASIPLHKESFDLAIAYQGPTDLIDFYISQKVEAKEKWSWVHFDVSNHQINEKLYTKLYEGFEKVMVVSQEAKKQLVKRIPTISSKAKVFPNIVSHEMIQKLAHEKIGLDSGFTGKKIVTVGRLSKEKGQDLAITVLANLRREGYNVRWYCVGEGNSRSEYEKLIKDYDLEADFILLGASINPYPYIQQADLYVQPSRHESYCLTLAEAKCLCKPIISTNFIGAKEQLVNGVNGWIVEANEEDLYKTIKKLLDHPEKIRWLTNNLKEESDTKNQPITINLQL